MNILDKIVKNKIIQIENEKIQNPLQSLINIESQSNKKF